MEFFKSPYISLWLNQCKVMGHVIFPWQTDPPPFWSFTILPKLDPLHIFISDIQSNHLSLRVFSVLSRYFWVTARMIFRNCFPLVWSSFPKLSSRAGCAEPEGNPHNNTFLGDGKAACALGRGNSSASFGFLSFSFAVCLHVFEKMRLYVHLSVSYVPRFLWVVAMTHMNFSSDFSYFFYHFWHLKF